MAPPGRFRRIIGKDELPRDFAGGLMLRCSAASNRKASMRSINI